MRKLKVSTLLIFSFFSSLLIAGEALPVSKISQNFVFDGQVSQGEWDQIQPVELTVQSPNYHGEPTQRTVIKLAYDESYIYLSGALYDDEPDKILANNKLRDGGDPSTDFFGLVIDSYNDNQNALAFFTTPTGSRFDAAVLNDGQGRNPMNLSWNNFWDVKTIRNDKGWFSEMRIPFSSLQFQSVDGKVTMGITIWRYIARSNEMLISPDISPDMGEMGNFRPSLAKEYVFEGVKQKKPFYITPYVLAGTGNTNALNEAGNQYGSDRKFIRDIGIDVKYGITNNFTLDLSLNTDFAQVEVDDQQINLSRFSLFFPEKRLFFQERSGIFDFGFGSRNNLFYSRRIGIDDDGNEIPIIGGARVTGRSGNTDIGVISMQTRGTDDLLSNNYSVFRAKRRIINENSDAGFLFTNNIDRNGKYNSVYGFDTQIKVYKNDYLSAKFAQSFTDGVESKLLSGDPTMFFLSLSRRPQKGFNYGLSLSRLGSDFDSNLGFLERENYLRFGTRLEYKIFPGSSSRILSHGIRLRGVSYWENTNNTYNSAFYGLGYSWQMKNGSMIEVGTRIQYDDITEEFDLADIVIIPVNSYFYQSYEIEFSTPSALQYAAKGQVGTGKFYDGWKSSFMISPIYNISPSLRLSADYEYNAVDFAVRDQNFVTHIARVKALYMFSTKFSISSFVQYNSIDKLYLANFRLRYNPKEGNDLYIVYNSDVNQDRDYLTPRLPATNESSILLKYSYTFTL